MENDKFLKDSNKEDQKDYNNKNTLSEKILNLKNKLQFKSVFTRLLVMYIGILFLSFAIIAVGLSTALETYFMKQKESYMITQSEKIARQYASIFFEAGGDKNSKALKLTFDLQMLDEYIGSTIWIMGLDGKLVSASEIPSLGENLEIDSEKENIFLKNLDEKFTSIFNGNIEVMKNKFNDVFAVSTLTVGCPIRSYGNVVGALLIHVPIPEIKESISGVYKVFLLCLFISILISFLLVYFTSKKMTKPLKNINEAAKVISNGNFNKRIDIESKDEIGQLAKSFNDMAEGLNRLEEYRSKFIANISHDLRSPVTSIQGFLNAILDGTIPQEKQEKYLKIVLDETNRLTKLTNDILELTKIENHEIELVKENFDINEMIRNIVTTFETRILEKNINMKIIFIDKNSWVYADAQKIERVLYNLLDNAVKFTQEGKDITISTLKSDNKILLSVSDKGIGMNEEELKHIFERFYKADSSRGKDKKGTGLGLAIVKEIIKSHKESVTVKSEIGIGTTFTISLTRSKEIF